jgi:hypothetical protein
MNPKKLGSADIQECGEPVPVTIKRPGQKHHGYGLATHFTPATVKVITDRGTPYEKHRWYPITEVRLRGKGDSVIELPARRPKLRSASMSLKSTPSTTRPTSRSVT